MFGSAVFVIPGLAVQIPCPVEDLNVLLHDENIVGIGENAGKPAFSPFPTMFSTLTKTNLLFG